MKLSNVFSRKNVKAAGWNLFHPRQPLENNPYYPRPQLVSTSSVSKNLFGPSRPTIAPVRLAIPASRTTPFYNDIASTAKRYGFNPKFLDAVVFAESSYNPRAVSKTGALGLGQLTPVALKDIGYGGPVERLYDPRTNLDLTAQYLSKIYDVKQKQLGRKLTPLEWYHAYSFGPYNKQPISPQYQSNWERSYGRY